MAERREQDYPLSHDNWVRSRTLFKERHLAQNDAISELDPDFGRLCIRFVHEHMYPRSTFSQRTRELCAVAALTATDKPGQLGGHIQAAIHAGARREEVLESIIQMIVFCGVPSTLNAVHIYRKTLADMAQAEPESDAVRAHQPPQLLAEDGLTVRERALKTGTDLYGEAEAGKLLADLDRLDPAFSAMYQELVLGGVQSRRVLDAKTLQLVGIAGSVVRNAMPMFETQAKAGLRLGLTPAEIREVVFQMTVYAGFPYVMEALKRLGEIVQATAATPA